VTSDATPALVNPKHRAFVEAYRAFGGNATRAAIEAGFSERRARQTAHELMKRPEIQAVLAADAPAGIIDVDPAYLVESLQQFVELGKRGEIPASAAIRAIETLGRWRGLDRRIIETTEEKIAVTMHLSPVSEGAA
jgi:phage terminase small subunit